MAIESQIINPSALSEREHAAFVEELFVLNGAIFNGVDRKTFERYLLGHGAQRTRIQVIREDERAVGYTAVQVYAYGSAEQRCLVMRSLAGMLPAYRRKTLFGWFMAYEALRLRAHHPATPIYGFACPVHPSTYRMLSRYAVDVWPQPQRPTPFHLHRIMIELAEHFGLQPEPGRPDVCQVGWRTIVDEQERRSWAESSHPASRFFVERNPRYEQGYGLLTLVPLRVSRVVQGSVKLLGKRVRRMIAQPRRAAA